MKPRSTPIWVKWLVLAIVSMLLVALYSAYRPRLARMEFLSGWLLFGVMLVLAGYNLRKKLPFLPWGTSESWLQFHVYLGFLTIVLFALHVRFALPKGWLEGILTWLYIVVMVSGIVGLWLSRRVPKRLTTRGGEVILEQIPTVRHELRHRAEELALQLVPEAQSNLIAEFYQRELMWFFAGPRHFWFHIVHGDRPINRLLDKIADQKRFLNEQESARLQQLRELVEEKNSLDYHYSLQLLLRLWLFVHIPFTYSLLIFAFAHLVLVYAFSGGPSR
jgi:hypothetical protein